MSCWQNKLTQWNNLRKDFMNYIEENKPLIIEYLEFHCNQYGVKDITACYPASQGEAVTLMLKKSYSKTKRQDVNINDFGNPITMQEKVLEGRRKLEDRKHYREEVERKRELEELNRLKEKYKNV